MSTILLHGLRPASNYARTQFTSGTSRLQYIRLASNNTATSTKSRTSNSPSCNASGKNNPAASTASAATTTPSPLNGPSTTRPAALNLPVRHPNQRLWETPFIFKHAYALGKGYAVFYKNGVKNTNINRKLARTLKNTIHQHHKSLSDAVSANALTRSEFQLLARNRHDLKRVPVFGLVYLVFGEFTPLIVIYFSSVVPWTCRLPKQIEGDRKTLEERRAISFRNLTDEPPKEPGTAGLSRQQLIHISWSLGLSSSAWDWLGGQYPGLPTFLLRRKVDKHVKYLEMDDALIKAAKVSLGNMDIEEVKMALVDRGVDILNVRREKLQKYLDAWLKSRQNSSVETLLLTRPNVWPVQVSKQK